ncbi:MAG TPA: MFS transporter [Verrucomicrobiae bacterium]|jgi:maltose/moltooligosaccharide transporter
MQKPQLSFWQIWNMSFGFLGIQFGWGLQMANMSPIYKYLGAADSQIPMLWLAAPLTGLLVQPIIGALSDRTWGKLGRRRPYFLVGAILSSLALIAMPNCSTLWMAAGLLWILDASINVSMEPFRAFVADKLPEEQRGTGFAMQSFFIGVGAVVAGLLPYILKNWFHVSSETGQGNAIPLNVRISFYAGAAAFLGAVLWTVFSTKEYPPEDLVEFRRQKKARAGFIQFACEIISALREMPGTMKQLALVQFFTWLGLFCMWLHFSNAVPVVFGSSDPDSELFKRGAEWAGVCYSLKDAVTFVAAFGLMLAARKFDRRRIHGVCLALGGIGLLAIGFIHGEEQKNWLLLSLALGGVAWASILSMPYAILAGALPAERMGVYMGIFNFFIVLPEIIAALTFGPLVKHLLGGNLVYAVMAGGICLLLAAALAQWVKLPGATNRAWASAK